MSVNCFLNVNFNLCKFLFKCKQFLFYFINFIQCWWRASFDNSHFFLNMLHLNFLITHFRQNIAIFLLLTVYRIDQKFIFVHNLFNYFLLFINSFHNSLECFLCDKRFLLRKINLLLSSKVMFYFFNDHRAIWLTFFKLRLKPFPLESGKRFMVFFSEIREWLLRSTCDFHSWLIDFIEELFLVVLYLEFGKVTEFVVRFLEIYETYCLSYDFFQLHVLVKFFNFINTRL